MAKSEKLIRRVETFKDVADRRRRRSPASIRRFLYDLIVRDFDRSCERAASALSGLLKRNPEAPMHRRVFSAEVLYKATLNASGISYNQLDGVALHYGVPMSLILLFTRVRSEVEASEAHSKASAQRVLRAFRAALDKLDSVVIDMPFPLEDVYGYFQHEKFLQIRESYLAAYEDEQPSLF